MAYYHKYKFVSAEPLCAEVKEELRSYFDTGIVDDLMFPRYIEDCLKRLGRSSYKIENNILRVENYVAALPEGFEGVRELWACTSYEQSYQLPGARYEEKSFRIEADYADYDRCDPLCAPDVVKVTYKTTRSAVQSFNVTELLRPGTIIARNNCNDECINVYSDSPNTFDIRDNKIITNFNSGSLYIVYYKSEYDSNEEQLIPDTIRTKDYLKAYLKYKCFEMIFNNVNDETYNQVKQKHDLYKELADQAYQNVKVDNKKKTIDQVKNDIQRMRKRFRGFDIS